MARYLYQYANYTLLSQQEIPSCAPPPVGCTLAITGYTATSVTVRGDDDGTITASISGWTGTTSNVLWYINGVMVHASGSTFTYTGLTAGNYNIQVFQEQCYDSVNGITVVDGEFRTAAFTIVAPTGLTATENPIIVKLSTGINSGNPLVGKSRFEVTGTISNNDSITIALEYPQNYTAVFTAKEFPNKDDYFLASVLRDGNGVQVGTNTATEIATSIAEALSKDIVLSRLYYFRASGVFVYAEAKETNAKLNLNALSVTLVGNITLTETQVGISAFDGQITQNYSLYCDIYVDDTAQYGQSLNINTFKKVSQLELPFRSNNQHVFDLAPVLKNFVSTSKIDFSITGYTTLADMMCAYTVLYGEKYPLIPNESTKKSRQKGQTSYLWCINSALDWEEVNNLDEHLGTGSPLLSGVKFLTTQPNPKQVNRQSSDYLYCILPRDYGYPLKVKGDLYFYDGSQLIDKDLYTITTDVYNWGGVFALAAGYNELNLAQYEVLTGSSTRKIRRVDFAIWQVSGGTGGTETQLTETISYRYEIDEQPRRYGVAFLAKHGVWSIWDFNGEIIDNVDFSNERMEVPREVNLKGDSPVGFQANTVYNTKVTKKIEANSGWIDREHFDWLIELLASNRIYCYTDENQPFLIVESVQYQASSNDDLFQIDVVFSETLQENNISV